MQQVPIRYTFRDKRLLQALTGLLPAKVARFYFKSLFNALERALQQAGGKQHTVFFFDYLDNTIGYLLHKKGSIAGYVNDVHGIATIEFKSSAQEATRRYKKVLFKLKYQAADRLDRKVFESARGFLFGSGTMQSYFEQRYNLAAAQSMVLPYLLDAFSLASPPDATLQNRLAGSLSLDTEHFVFMFVGSYKATAGTGDLIAAFSRLHAQNPHCRLVLIGDGAYRPEGERQAQQSGAAAAIQFLDPVPYAQLPAYYALAHVIVCPDRDNPFSQYVVHIKYLDALATGKLVINGAFRSVQELNASQPLSLLFQPSSVDDLHRTIEEACRHYPALRARYSGAAEQVKKMFTYAASVAPLATFNTAVQP